MNEADIILIDKFLDNELNEEELEIFKEKYGKDPEFTSEVNALSKFYICLDAASKLSIDTMANKPQLRNFISVKKDKTEATRGMSKVFYKIAAIVIPLIGLGGLIFPFVYTKHSDENLYAKYYTKPASLGSAKGISNEKPFDFQGLQDEVDKTASAHINSLNTNEELFSFGIYSMDNKHYNEAIIAFNLILSSSNNIYRPDSEWYLALCYLKTGNKDKSIGILKEIVNNKGHLHFINAEKLLKKLR